jgi:hypothetical protein
VAAEEFLRRYLPHVLPTGCQRVRNYGLWSPANRDALRRLQILLPVAQPGRTLPALAFKSPPPARPTCCPRCGSAHWVVLGRFPAPALCPMSPTRGPPPWAPAAMVRGMFLNLDKAEHGLGRT